MFIRNTWYIVAEPNELEGKPLARTILGQPVVVFLTESGKPVALEDRCPHRFVPLSLGRVVGERIQCGYHGATFDGDGNCVLVPGQDMVPPKANVRSFPIIKKYGYYWIWMGAPNLSSNTDSIPDFLYRSDHPDWDGGYGHFESIQANYNLINDNLFDITHAEYVHPGSFGGEEMRMYRNASRGDAFVDGKTTYSIREREIVFRIRSLNMEKGGPFYRWMVASSKGSDEYEGRIDLDMEVSWGAPSFTSFLLNARPAGEAPENGVQVCNMHGVTPETETKSHYFYRSVKNYGSSDLVEVFMSGVKAIFDQDKPILEAQQAAIGNHDLFSLRPISFSGDVLQRHARKINSTLLEEDDRS